MSPKQVREFLSVVINNLPIENMPEEDLDVLVKRFETRAIRQMLFAPECVIVRLLGCGKDDIPPFVAFEDEIRAKQLHELNGKLMLADAVTALVGTMKPAS